MSTTAPGRRSRARSGLDQLDVAEDLFAVVAAAVAVVVTQFVVHVLDHGRGADRRITINRVGRRRITRNHLLEIIREGPDTAARDLQVADHAVWLDVAELISTNNGDSERRDLVRESVFFVEHGRGQNATNRWPPSHLFASYGVPRVVSELSDSQE